MEKPYEKRSTYQMLYNGEKIKKFHGASPSAVAKKMAKEIFIEQGATGTKKITVKFVKNQVQALGGDKFFAYVVQVTKLAKPESIIAKSKDGSAWKHIVTGSDGREYQAPVPKIYKRYETKIIESGLKPRGKTKK